MGSKAQTQDGTGSGRRIIGQTLSLGQLLGVLPGCPFWDLGSLPNLVPFAASRSAFLFGADSGMPPPTGNVCTCLEDLIVVPAHGEGGDATGIWWVEARVIAKPCTIWYSCGPFVPVGEPVWFHYY